jgi:hypothetical protein
VFSLGQPRYAYPAAPGQIGRSTGRDRGPNRVFIVNPRKECLPPGLSRLRPFFWLL